MFDTLHFIDDPHLHGAAMNMAIDEVLLLHAVAPTLRIYRWARPAISFGYFEKWEPVREAHPRRELVRRWTGGGVVPHGEDFTYSIILPPDVDFSPRGVAESYCVIHQTIAAVLRVFGFDAVVANADETKRSSACFENPVRSDILLNNRKIAGAAQRRVANGCLHQGSIQSLDLSPAFGEALAHAFAKKLQREKFESLDEAAALAESKYATESWTQKV